MQITVGLKGRDTLILDYEMDKGQFKFVSLRAIGCHSLLEKAQVLRGQLKSSFEKLALPEGDDHSALLLRELVMKLQGSWKYPYESDEICHCRAIPLARVDEAIVAGSHRVEEIAECTSAGSACGSCRTDTQKIIDFRLNKKAA